MDTLFVPGTVITKEWLNDVNRKTYTESLNAKSFGAIGNGIVDDTVALQNAINSIPQYGQLFIPAGIYIISNTLTIPSNNIQITGSGAKIIAKDAVQFEYMLLATSKTGVAISNLHFDANKDNRKATQNVRYMGAAFLTCTECSFTNVQASNCLGYNNVSGVALAAAGGSIRCRIDSCFIGNCGETGHSPAKDADAVFTSGEQNVISNSIATNCTDTGFVIESSNQSVITGCTTRLCGAGCGITSANASDKSGNTISGVTIHNWYGSVGAIQIGVPGGYTGNLLNSQVSDVTLVAETPTYGGPGPAIVISSTVGFGMVQNLLLSNIRIRGAATQGIYVSRGSEVHVQNAHISGTTDACIQFQEGTGHKVTASYLSGGSYGVVSLGASEVFVTTSIIRDSTSYGIYADNTSTIYQKDNIILSPTTAAIGKAAGATIGFGDITLTYSASITPNASLGNHFTITATNTTPFTINNATVPALGQTITFTILNSSGGSMGVITWGTGYYKSVWTNPANGFNRSISFKWDGSAWIQINQTGVDIPN